MTVLPSGQVYSAAAGALPRPPFGRLHLYPLQVKSAAEQAFEGWASTPAVDREGEVVLPEALAAALRDYMRNPIVTYAHDWLNPIGRTIEARATEAGLWVRIQLGRTSRAREVWQLIEDRILRSLSIGFNAGAEEGFERDGVWYWRRIELLEIAVVPIPANPKATISMARHLGLDPRSPIVVQKALAAQAETPAAPAAAHALGGANLRQPPAPAGPPQASSQPPSEIFSGAAAPTTGPPATNSAPTEALRSPGRAPAEPCGRAQTDALAAQKSCQPGEQAKVSADALLAALLEHLDPQTLARLVREGSE